MAQQPNTPTPVRRLSLPPGRRVLAVSDIHGNLDFLQGLLTKAAFTPNDILFVVGDILEKGPRSLDTLRFLRKLSETHTVYALRGNCDQITLDFMDGTGWPEELLWHVLCSWEERGLLMQMAAEGGLTLRGTEDFPALRELVRTRFAPELAFLKAMPAVIETEHYIFVHGGIPAERGWEALDVHALLKNDDFVNQGLYFHKWVIVGHWPVTLYNPHIQSSRPLVSAAQHIVSIDGGCVLKKDGQLNALLLPPDPEHGAFDYLAYDGLPVMTALDDQAPSQDPLNIRWSDSVVDLLERGDELSLCRHRSSGRELLILTCYLRTGADGALRCEDSTDYRLPVSAGDRLSIVHTTSSGALVKKNGVTGWYFGRLA